MKSRRSHPVWQAFDTVAMGEMPSPRELDELAELAPGEEREAFRSALESNAERIVEIHKSGQFGLARAEAAGAVYELLNVLEDTPEPIVHRDLPDDPRELAALVLDRGSGLIDEVAAIPRDINY